MFEIDYKNFLWAVFVMWLHMLVKCLHEVITQFIQYKSCYHHKISVQSLNILSKMQSWNDILQLCFVIVYIFKKYVHLLETSKNV